MGGIPTHDNHFINWYGRVCELRGLSLLGTARCTSPSEALAALVIHLSPTVPRTSLVQPSHCPVPSPSSASALDWSPISSRRLSIVLLDQPAQSPPRQNTAKISSCAAQTWTCVVEEACLSYSWHRSTPLSNEPAHRRYARVNGRELDRHVDNQLRTNGPYLCLSESSTARSFRGSPLSCQGLCPVLLNARVLGFVNASAWAHRGVHPSHL